jgi:hypothetical protein
MRRPVLRRSLSRADRLRPFSPLCLEAIRHWSCSALARRAGQIIAKTVCDATYAIGNSSCLASAGMLRSVCLPGRSALGALCKGGTVACAYSRAQKISHRPCQPPWGAGLQVIRFCRAHSPCRAVYVAEFGDLDASKVRRAPGLQDGLFGMAEMQARDSARCSERPQSKRPRRWHLGERGGAGEMS